MEAVLPRPIRLLRNRSALDWAYAVALVAGVSALVGCVSIDTTVSVDTVAPTSPLDGAVERTDGPPTTATRVTTTPLPAVTSTSASQSTATTAPGDRSTTPSTSTDPRPLALDVLATISIENEHPDGYSRDLFEHWITRNGCTTRESVLIRESLTYPQVDPVGCTVVAVRNLRRDANEAVKKLVKDKLASEDEQKRAEADIQKTTDKFIAEVDKAVAAKEQDIMAV